MDRESIGAWYPELEQFLGIGESKLIWRLSLKNVGGLLAGAFLSHRLATLIGMRGLAVLAVTLVGIVVGIWLTTQQKGLMRLLRLWLVVRLLARQALGTTTIDSAQWAGTVEEAPPRLRVQARPGGAGLALRTRRSTAPVVSQTRRNGHEAAEL